MPVTLQIPKDRPCNPLAGPVSFTVPVRPTTKKTSNRIVPYRKQIFNKKTRRMESKLLHAVLPSEDFMDFEAQCVSYAATICNRLKRQGVRLPITSPISIRALIYREKRIGDHCGFTQAVGDALKTMGIIVDDRIIDDWDGTRRLHDKAFPRLEIFISPVGDESQEELF